MFNMVTGVPPFYNEEKRNDSEMYEMIRAGNWKEKMSDYYNNPSPNLMSILHDCFQTDAEHRIDSTALIMHPFFQLENAKYKDLPPKKVYEAFMSARHFKPKNLFQKEVLSHMVGRFITFKEKEFLRKIFDALDDEKDGELTADEFCTQFKEKF